MKFAWWTTGRDAAALVLLRTVIHAIENGTISGEIAYLFCSKEPGESEESDALMALAQSYDIPTVYYSALRFRPKLRRSDRQHWGDSYHRQVLQRIPKVDTDIVVLAGYMWVVSAEVCEQMDIINLHPAAPGGPVGTWQEVIWELIRQDAQETGVMMHLVTPELDEGPPVTYCHFPIKGVAWDHLWSQFREKEKSIGFDRIMEEEGESEPLFSAIRREGVKRELPLIVQTLKSFALGEVKLINRRLFNANGKELSGPYDLTDAIENMLTV